MPVKTVVRARAKTIDEAIIIMTERMAESKVESDAKIAESRAYFEKSIAESDAKIAESRAYFEKSIAESDAKIAKRMVESKAYSEKITAESKAYSEKILAESKAYSEKIMAESQAQVDLALKKLIEQVEKTSKRVDEYTEASKRDFSRINKRLGYLIEFIVAPGIRQDMNACGHNFRYAAANKIFKGVKNGQKCELAEADLFLSNGTETMAVEVKTTLTLEKVKDHLDRLSTLREFEKYTKIEGKNLFGAVAGVFINDKAREYALKNGLYVIEIEEDEKKLKIDKPKRCKIW